MKKLEWIQARRAELAARYDALLAEFDWLQTPRVPEGDTHGYQSYVCVYRPETPTMANVDALFERRNAMMMSMEAQGVSTRQGTHAVHGLGLFRDRFGLRPEDYPQAWIAERVSLALPLFPTMTDAEQDRVVELLRAHA
jgi:dTDP-4-amino-4,6-dideoxygalactose transaminase